MSHVRPFSSFAFEGEDIRTDIEEKYHYDGRLLKIFESNHGEKVHKWHHYIPLYERYFAPYLKGRVRLLEIGVSKGGSLQVWRKFFGTDAVIFGIDIDPNCAVSNGKFGQVRIGSQDDKDFLEAVVHEMGGIDIVLDDGSHHMKHIRASLEILFPHLRDGGIYVIEDLHTSYWKDFGGGYATKNNFFNQLIYILHDMHHWYHGKKPKISKISQACTGVHIHDSFVVLEKGKVYSPVYSTVG